MASFIELIAKIKQKNNGTFKLVDAQDVECEEGKGLDEVLNEKLDKNQGVENAGKTMIVGDDGNLVVGDSSPKNVYTKEEVDYMLADKMDKPYVPIEITDNATITDALDGNFKIDKIKGNTYQKVETDIVPTPNRPVPINSRKTLVTKANPNIFNLEKESDTSNIPDSGTYRSVGQYQLKANTKYIFEWSEATVPAKATLSFQIQDDKGTVLVSPFTYFNLETTEKKETGKQVEFTTNSSGIVKFAYNCTVGTSNTIETYQQYWYTKILKDITLKENATFEPEYIELRSLKETTNLFDKNIMAFTSGTLNNDGTVGTNVSYAVSGFVPVKPSTQYTIKVIDGFRGSTKVYYDINKQLISNEAIATFTTPSNCYFVRWQTATTDTRVLTEEDIKKINDEMMMVKGNSLPSSYVAPTVRDYKIVDHVNKTSKIVRNVKVVEDIVMTVLSVSTNKNVNALVCIDTLPDILNYGYANVFKTYHYTDDNMGHWMNKIPYYITKRNYSTTWIGVDTSIDDVGKAKAFLEKVTITAFGQLATPTEISIPYVETDDSEVGYSWQDTTSPSPSIKSEVQGVEEIDILKTGKNLFDIEKAKDELNWTESIKQGGYIDFMIKVIKGRQYTFSYSNKLDKGLGFFAGIVNDENITNSTITHNIYHTALPSLIVNSVTFTTKSNYISLRVNSYGLNKAFENFKDIQLELGDTRTAYEPYTEQRVNYTPTNLLYSTQDGSICDYVDVEKGVEVYQLGAKVYDGSVDEVIAFGWEKTKTVNFTIANTMANINKAYSDRFQNFNSASLDQNGISNNSTLFYISIEKTLLSSIDVNGFRTWLSQNPITVVYPLATPTEIPTPEEDLAKLKSLKTSAGVNNIFINGEVKPTINARYPQDVVLAVNRLQNKLLTLQEEVSKNV